MGKEMGNNNTSAIKEEDNISEADKKNLIEDNISENANKISREENQNIPKFLSKDDVMEKASNTSSDIKIELGKDVHQEDDHANDDVKEKIEPISIAEANDGYEKATRFDSSNTSRMLESDYSLDVDAHASDTNMENQIDPTAEKDDVITELANVSLQEESHGDDVKEKSQMILTDEAKDVEEKDTKLVSHNIESKLEIDSLEGYTHDHESDINMENQMHPKAEEEDVQEKGSGLNIEDATMELEKVFLQEESCGDDAKERSQMIPTDKAKDVEEKATKLISNYIESKPEIDSFEGDANKSDIYMENQMHPTDEAEYAEEKAVGGASEHTRSSIENDLLKGTSYDQEIAAGLAYDDKTSELDVQDESQEDKQDGKMTIPLNDDIDVQGKTTILASDDDPFDLKNSFAGEEEDNISETDKKNLLEDTGEHANEISQEENQNIPQEDAHDADDVKEKIQTISIVEANDAYEKATWFDSNNKTSMLESDYSLEDTHAGDISMENQIHPQAEEEDVEEKAKGLDSEDATTELGKVSMQEKSHDNDVKEETQMIPTDEVKDVEEKGIGLIAHCIESQVENDSLEGDTNESDMDMENQMHITDEAEDVEEKAIGMDSEHTRSSLENDLSKSNDHEIAAGLSSDGKTSELEDEDKNDGNMIIPFNKDIDVQGKTTILASSVDQTISGNSFSGEVEGKSCESMSSSSTEGSEEYVKQEDSCKMKNLSGTYNHCLNEVSSIKQDEEETSVLTLVAMNTSNDSEHQESPSVHHDEVVEFPSDHSLQGNESRLKDTLPDADSHFQHIKHDVSEKYMESQELLCSNKLDESDGNEFVNDLMDTSETLSEPASIGIYNNEEKCKVLNEENKLSESGPTNVNPHDCKQDQCIKELQEYKSDMANIYDITIGSNGDCNRETHAALDSSVLDAYVSNSIKGSDESSAAQEENNHVVHEVEPVFLIAGSTDVDCIHEKGENNSNKLEDTDEKTESYDMLTINQEESFSLQNSSSLLHIYKYQQGNVEQTKSFTATTILKSDEEEIEKEREDYSQHSEATSLIVEKLTTSTELSSNNSTFANGGYETRENVTRLSTESNSDNPNITCQMQKSPSFNLNLRMESRREESDQIPLLDKSSDDSLSNKARLNISNSMSHDEYGLIEEKIVTMERSYSEISKASFIGFLKEEEAHVLVMAQTQDINAGSKIEVKEVSSTSPKGKEKRKSRSYFFTSCMCCATVPN